MRKYRSVGPSSRDFPVSWAPANMLACEPGTTFGLAVVPDVCDTMAMSSGRAKIGSPLPVTGSPSIDKENIINFICRHIVWRTLHPDYIFLMYFARCQLTISITLVLVLGPKVSQLFLDL